jgi:hypothetical protein
VGAKAGARRLSLPGLRGKISELKRERYIPNINANKLKVF